MQSNRLAAGVAKANTGYPWPSQHLYFRILEEYSNAVGKERLQNIMCNMITVLQKRTLVKYRQRLERVH